MNKMQGSEQDSMQVAQCIRVGDRCPDIEFEYFQNDTVKKARISDYLNHWLVLFFYPADFTFVCPTELQELGTLYKDIRKLDAELISVSADTVFTHKAWHDTSPSIKNISFPMAADPAGRLSRAFGTHIPNDSLDHRDDEGLSLRGTFIIDPDGILRTSEIHDNGIGRSGKELVRKLQAAQFVATNGGQVCPAEWQPGDSGLKGGDMNLVGKI